jgi:hypothetical protein
MTRRTAQTVQVITSMLSRVGLVLLLAGVGATAAHAQDEPSLRPLARFSVPPTPTEVLLTTQAVLHTADMITTAYGLSLSQDAHEANPFLGSFSQSPVRLAIVSGAVDVLQVYTISKLQPRHPKIARWWAVILVATEVWTTINNINAVGELERRTGRVARP